MHSRDAAVLSDLMLCTTPANFSTFFQFTIVPTLVDFLVYVLVRTVYNVETGQLILQLTSTNCSLYILK